MTTTQALRIEHTIRDMKRAMSRDDDGDLVVYLTLCVKTNSKPASDSDSSITRHTNRGNKLKRKAKHVREGRLAQADGPRVYKKVCCYEPVYTFRHLLTRPAHIVQRLPTKHHKPKPAARGP